MNAVLALDIGSSSIRCIAYQVTDDNTVKAIPNCNSAVKLRSVVPITGHLQLSDDSGSLFEKIDHCVGIVLEKLDDDFSVVAIGVSSFVMNLVAVDLEGIPIGDQLTLSYACNTPEIAHECERVRVDLGPEQLDRLYDQTGAPIHSAYAIPQLRMLYQMADRRTEVDKIHKWQTIASMCIARWTGVTTLPISISEVSWCGLLNFRDCTYDEDALQLLPDKCRQALPDLVDFSETIAGLPETTAKGRTNSYWSRWPRLRSAQLFYGIGDGACANVGSKCSTVARIAVTVGTSAAARICLPQGIGSNCTLHSVPKGLFCYRVSRENLLVGGALTDGGSIVEWLQQLLNLQNEEDFQTCMEQVQSLANKDYSIAEGENIADSNNVVILPFLSGERSTGYRGGATGAVVGLTRETTAAHLVKSSLEGVSLRLRAIVQLILEARESSNESSDACIVVSGKSMEVNALWRQMVADACQLRVLLDLDTHEGTSRGAAILVAAALKAQRNQNNVMPLKEEELTSVLTSEPQPGGMEYFDRAASRQDRFLSAVSPVFSS